MPGTSPIPLGSAVSGWTFESGSGSSTDQYGIQTCTVQGLFPNGATVFSNIPAVGSSFSAIFGGSYLPSDFKLDFFQASPSVAYVEATVARATFQFKRLDPLSAGIQIVSVDTILDYTNNALSQVLFWTSGISQNNVFGFPQPIVTVVYSTSAVPTTPPIYISTKSGFPDVSDIDIAYTARVAPGSVVNYWDGSTFQSLTVHVATTFIFNLVFISNPRGWQLVKFKYDGVANRSFFSVEEQWRNFYTFQHAELVSHTP